MLQDDLGGEVKSDRDGVLQDMQWSAGQFGIFCGYTVGNIIAAQMQKAARAAVPSIADDLEQGEYTNLRNWQGENLHTHRRRYTRDEILKSVTDRGVDAGPYVDYLTQKI